MTGASVGVYRFAPRCLDQQNENTARTRPGGGGREVLPKPGERLLPGRPPPRPLPRPPARLPSKARPRPRPRPEPSLLSLLCPGILTAPRVRHLADMHLVRRRHVLGVPETRRFPPRMREGQREGHPFLSRDSITEDPENGLEAVRQRGWEGETGTGTERDRCPAGRAARQACGGQGAREGSRWTFLSPEELDLSPSSTGQPPEISNQDRVSVNVFVLNKLL